MKQQNNRIQAVLFDLDDTLIDWSELKLDFEGITRPHANKIYDYLQAENHQLPSRDDFLKCYLSTIFEHWEAAKKDWTGISFDNALKAFLTELGLDAAQIDVTAVMRAYDLQPMPGVTVFDDTHEVLAQLRQRGYKVGLITNSMMPMWMRDVELRAYGMIDAFDMRMTAGDIGYLKPHPAIYHHALNELGVTPETAVFVGDRPAHDIVGANDAGLISVLMSPPHLNRDLNGAQPDHIITYLSELLTILDELES